MFERLQQYLTESCVGLAANKQWRGALTRRFLKSGLKRNVCMMKNVRAGVCVCKPQAIIRFGKDHEIIQAGDHVSISPWPTKLLMFGEDMKFDQLHVPAFQSVCVCDHLLFIQAV